MELINCGSRVCGAEPAHWASRVVWHFRGTCFHPPPVCACSGFQGSAGVSCSHAAVSLEARDAQRGLWEPGWRFSPAVSLSLPSQVPLPAVKLPVPWCLPTATKAADQTTVLTHHHQFCHFH